MPRPKVILHALLLTIAGLLAAADCLERLILIAVVAFAYLSIAVVEGEKKLFLYRLLAEEVIWFLGLSGDFNNEEVYLFVEALFRGILELAYSLSRVFVDPDSWESASCSGLLRDDSVFLVYGGPNSGLFFVCPKILLRIWPSAFIFGHSSLLAEDQVEELTTDGKFELRLPKVYVFAG